jgi:hypothetical protein
MLNINLFKNDRKEEGDNQPLYRNAKIVSDEDIVIKAGVPYEGALWVKKKTKSGQDTDMVSIQLKTNDFLIAKQNEDNEEEKNTTDIPF